MSVLPLVVTALAVIFAGLLGSFVLLDAILRSQEEALP